MDHFTCIMMMMMMTLAVYSSSLSGLGFSITNGPQDTTVCMNDMAECTCGFDGVSPFTIPDWIIVTKNSSGSVIGNVTIDGKDILMNVHHGFRWIFGQRNSTSAPNGRLVVGPVNNTHNQSSYQCLFRFVNQFDNGSTQFHTVKSSVGTLTVVGPPSIVNIVVDETCATSISISWDTHIHSVCGVVTQSVAISSSTSDAKKFPTNDNHFIFTNLTSNTPYNVTITLRYKRLLNQIRSRSTVIKIPPFYPPPAVFDITTKAENDDTKITWKVPEINCSVAEITHYKVTILTKEKSTSKSVTVEEVYLSIFLIYQSNISYTVIITAINSQGSSEPTSITIANDVIPQNDNDDDDQCSSMMIGFSVIIVVLVLIIIGVTAVMMWHLHVYKHKREAVIPKTQQLTTNMIEMQSSPAYAPMSQDNIKSSTVPQYETIQHCNDVRMDTNPAYLTHKNT